MSKTVLFQAIKFSISMLFNSIWPIDMALLGATTLGQSGPASDGDEEVLHIPQSANITGTPPSDCLVLYPGYSLRGGVLPLCREAVGVFYSPSQLGNQTIWCGILPGYSSNGLVWYYLIDDQVPSISVLFYHGMWKVYYLTIQKTFIIFIFTLGTSHIPAVNDLCTVLLKNQKV